MSTDPHSKKNAWRTPPEILGAMDMLLGDWFDPCPPKPHFDGLSPDTRWGKSNYVNCPFGSGQILKWGQKAVIEHDEHEAERSIFLHPYANSANRDIFKERATFFGDFYSPRLAFINAETGKPESQSNIDCCLYFWGEFKESELIATLGEYAVISRIIR